MTQKYGSAFKQPLDFATGKPIPGSPRMAVVGGDPYTAPHGYVVLAPEGVDVPKGPIVRGANSPTGGPVDE